MYTGRGQIELIAYEYSAQFYLGGGGWVVNDIQYLINDSVGPRVVVTNYN